MQRVARGFCLRRLWSFEQKLWRDLGVLAFSGFSFGFLIMVVAGCSKPYSDEEISKLIPLPSAFSNALDSSAKSGAKGSMLGHDAESSTPQEEQSFSQALLSLLDDSNLATLLDLALKRNTNLLTLTSQIAQARESLGLASANMLPKLSLGMGYNYSSGNYNRYQININQNTLNANLSLSWELDLFGKLNMLRKSKRYEYLATLSNLSVAQVSLISEVASNYFAYKRLAGATSLQCQIITNAQQMLAISQERYELGLVDIAIIEGYKNTLASATSSLNALSLQQEQMKNALLILLNTSDTEEILPLLDSARKSSANSGVELAESSIDSRAHNRAEAKLESSAKSSTPPATMPAMLPSPALPDINALPQAIILSRDDVRASIAQLNAQLMLKNSKKAALFPTLNLGGSLGQILFSTRGVGDLVWNITGSLLAPVLNRAAITKDYKIQKEALKQATYALENTLRVAVGEIENAIKEVNTTSDSLQGRLVAFATSQEAWTAAKERYALGLLDEESYLTSYNSFLSARASLDEAKLARISSIIMLYKALGGRLSYSAQGIREVDSTN